VENIAGYVYDHTRCGAPRWHRLESRQRGPFYVWAINEPRLDAFLKFVRSHVEKKPGCDPLDGQAHSLEEVTRWIGIRELGLRFIGLGVLLGVFRLVKPWLQREDESHEDMLKRLQQEDGARFQLSSPQASSAGLTGTHAGSRPLRAENGTPIIVTSSAELVWAMLPSSSTTTSARRRPWSRGARRPAGSDSWPTGRTDRRRRG
jgi:hypothetical protein